MTEARRLLDDGLSFGSAAERFGVPLAGIESLVAVGRLEQIRHPVVDAIRKDRMLARSSCEELISRLRSRAAAGIDAPMQLRIALRHVGGRLKPWAAVCDAMLSSDLPFRLLPAASRSTRLIDRIEVPASMVPLLARMPERPSVVDVHRSATMPRRDAQWLLNLNPKMLSIALQAELSSAIDADGDLVVERVLALARSRIGGGEVAARFMAGSRRLPVILRVGGLPRLGATGWDRIAVEKALA